MYIFGGLSKSLISNSQLWAFDLKESVWETISTIKVDRKEYSLEGHASALWDTDEPQIISYGGFYMPGGYSSSILSYNIKTGEWNYLFNDFEKAPNSTYPTKRAAAGVTLS